MMSHLLKKLRFFNIFSSGNLSDQAIRISQSFLSLAIILSPWRYRLQIFTLSMPPIYADYTDGLIFLCDIFMLAAMVLGGIGIALRHNKIHWGTPSIAVPVLGLILVSLVGVPFSVNPMISIYHSIRLGLLFGFFLYLVNIKPEPNRILWAVAGMIAIQAVVGSSQVLLQRSLGLQFLGEYKLDPAWSGVSIVWAEGVRSLRAYGLSDHPNILGGMFAFGFIILINGLLNSEGGKRALINGILLAGMMGFFFTFSRAAWLSFAAGIGFLMLSLVAQRSMKEVGLLLGVFISALVVLMPILISQAPLLGVRLNIPEAVINNAVEHRSITERGTLNQAASLMFTQHAVFGVGLGTFPVALKELYPAFPYHYQPAHNTILLVAAETGIFGAMFYVALMVIPWLMLLFQRKQIIFTLALVTSSALLLTIFLVGMFDYYTWLLTPGRFWQFLALGLWSNAYLASKRK